MIRGLLVVVALMALAVPFFNTRTPLFFGIPFFYWYQLAIVPIGALLIMIVHVFESAERKRSGR